LDVVMFKVPSGIEGCYVPVVVQSGGVSGNHASMAISSTGAACADPVASSPASIVGKPTLSTGFILLSRMDIPDLAAYGIGVIDMASASFEKNVANSDLVKALNLLANLPESPAGTCSVNVVDSTDPFSAGDAPTFKAVPLDAGPQLTLTGPAGTTAVTLTSTGHYETESIRPFLASGPYKIDNGPGGKDVGPFSAQFHISTPTLTSNVSRIPRSKDLTVNWTPGANDTGLVYIAGSSGGACGQQMVTFTCFERATAGRFTIPARILSQLPPGTGAPGFTGGMFQLGSLMPNGQRLLRSSGLDIGVIVYLNLALRYVAYE
jgi:hypothetical protein